MVLQKTSDKLKILELFCGTKSFASVSREREHQICTVDIDKGFEPDICKDIMDVTAQEIIEKLGGYPDVIWASPPCTTFSVASIRHYWKDGKPKNEKALHGLKILKKTIELIKELRPRFFIIENPRGMMRKQKMMEEFKRDTVTYCQYGHKVQKPTDLWNNIEWVPKPMCRPGSECHERASRGAKNGVQGINNSFSNLGSKGRVKRAIVPRELCLEIIKACEVKA